MWGDSCLALHLPSVSVAVSVASVGSRASALKTPPVVYACTLVMQLNPIITHVASIRSSVTSARPTTAAVSWAALPCKLCWGRLGSRPEVSTTRNCRSPSDPKDSR
jgi:hypothetical protein